MFFIFVSIESVAHIWPIETFTLSPVIVSFSRTRSSFARQVVEYPVTVSLLTNPLLSNIEYFLANDTALVHCSHKRVLSMIPKDRAVFRLSTAPLLSSPRCSSYIIITVALKSHHSIIQWLLSYKLAYKIESTPNSNTEDSYTLVYTQYQ